MWLILEMWPSPAEAHIVTDENGENLVFDNQEDAEQFASESCQDAIAIQVA
jgi:hypothetical protein